MLSRTLVRDFMAANPKSIQPECTVAEARELLETNQIRHLPILDNSNKICGILSDRDLKSAQVTINLFSRSENVSMTVDKLMSQPVVTVEADQPLYQAANIMAEKKIACLPVLENERLVGMLSYIDILNSLTTFSAYCDQCHQKYVTS